MSEILKSAVEERQKLWHEAKAVIDGAEAEGRSLSGEEESKYQTLSAELDKRAAFIEEYKKTADREARAAEAAEGFLAPATQAAVKSDADHIRALARGEVRSFEFGNEQRALSPSTTGAPIPTVKLSPTHHMAFFNSLMSSGHSTSLNPRLLYLYST